MRRCVDIRVDINIFDIYCHLGICVDIYCHRYMCVDIYCHRVDIYPVQI